MENLRLLLVDDEEDFRRTIAKRLGRRGIVPREAGDGPTCLQMLAEKPADVVVLDVKMPGMDGITVLQEIKTRYPSTEVILLTGHVTTRDGVDGIKFGAFDYLTKPVELEHLLGKIRQAFDKILREQEKQREMTFRSEMEQQMIACERLASVGTLAAGVAHEINNPLAIINESVGYMKMLLKKEELADMSRRSDFDKALGKIEKAVDRARRITHQLLGVARKNDAVVAEINLLELTQEAFSLVHREAANKDIVLEAVKEGEAEAPILLWSDAYRLRQVLVNLLTNAIHATGSGGRITVFLSAEADKVRLNVQDTGHGIPRENLERIFEPFFSTKSPGEGTGLGLFVTRGIVEELGGTIEVKSRLGEGSIFKVMLPRLTSTAASMSPEDQSELLGLIKENIKNYNSTTSDKE